MVHFCFIMVIQIPFGRGRHFLAIVRGNKRRVCFRTWMLVATVNRVIPARKVKSGAKLGLSVGFLPVWIFFIAKTLGFPGGSDGKRICQQCRWYKRHRFDPWVGKIPWGRKWQPAPVFLLGKSHGQRSLRGYNPWCHKELGMTEQLSIYFKSYLF